MKTHLILKDPDQSMRHQEVALWEQEVVFKAQLFKTKANLRLLKKDNSFDQAQRMKVANTKDQLLEAISESKTNCKIDKEPKRKRGIRRIDRLWNKWMTRLSILEMPRNRAADLKTVGRVKPVPV